MFYLFFFVVLVMEPSFASFMAITTKCAMCQEDVPLVGLLAHTGRCLIAFCIRFGLEPICSCPACEGILPILDLPDFPQRTQSEAGRRSRLKNLPTNCQNLRSIQKPLPAPRNLSSDPCSWWVSAASSVTVLQVHRSTIL